MTRWGVDVETLKRDAWANTMAKRPPIMIDMMDACHLDFSRKHLEPHFLIFLPASWHYIPQQITSL